MDKLPFMKKLEQFEKEHIANIDKKNAVIQDLQKKVDNKKREIDIKQADYNLKPSDNLFQDLLTLKRDLEGLKINVRSAAEIIQIPPVKTVDPDEVIKEVKKAIEDLELEKFRTNILKAKENYQNSVDEFVAKTKELSNLSNDLSSYNVGVSFDDIFKSYNYVYYVDDKSKLTEFDIRNIAYKFGHAQGNVNSTFIGTHRK